MTEAPDHAALLVDFVNTVELPDGEDTVGTPEQLAAWLTAHDLAPAHVRVTRRQHDEAIRLREALRAHLVAHDAGRPLDQGEAETLGAIATRHPLKVVVDGRPRLVPLGHGVDAAMGRILAAVADARADGSWSRLKACAADSCRWAFYDTSRNRSRAWCSMESCGNRAKTRSYRARHQGGGSGD